MDRKTNCNVSAIVCIHKMKIGCDSEKSKWKWFHLQHGNLKQVPRNNWHCPVCGKEK